MKLGIAVWDEQVSPLLDAAGQLLLVEVENQTIISQQLWQLPLSIPAHRVAAIQESGIDVLICGALSRHYERLLQLNSIKTIAWVRGHINDVMAAYLAGELDRAEYCLPGRTRVRGRRRSGKGCKRVRNAKPGYLPEEER